MRVLTDRNLLIQAVEELSNKGGFAVSLGQCALLADKDNLKKLVEAFPEYFVEQKAKIRLIWTQPLSTSKTSLTELSK